MYSSEKGVGIRALMSGDTSKYGGDESAADQALCNHLAFWTGGDAPQMDRIFRSSGLMRAKWDEKRGDSTYGERTIAKAIADCNDFYKPAMFRRATGERAARDKSTDAAPSFDPWLVDSAGRLWRSADGESFRHITFTPPFIKADLRDVDSRMARALVGMRVYGRSRECVLDRALRPSPDTQGKAKPFLLSKGRLEEWVAGMERARRRSTAFRAALAASFASPPIAVIGTQTLIVYVRGKSRSGKTPTLKAAGSVWGNPSEGTDSYYRTFADAPKSIVRSATFLGDIPILLDELQSKGAAGGQKGKQQAVEDLLYGLSQGHERGALNSNRTMMGYGSWRALTIATGEIPIIIDSTQQGAVNRTLEVNAEPFDDPREAQAMHQTICSSELASPGMGSPTC